MGYYAPRQKVVDGQSPDLKFQITDFSENFKAQAQSTSTKHKANKSTKHKTKMFNRILLFVVSRRCRYRGMPDAPEWGDAGSDTFGHILESRPVHLPNLQRYGLGNIRPLRDLPPLDNPVGSFGRCALRSNGKDTTTGHWEMAGIILEQAFPTYPNGFPVTVIDRFVKETSVPGILGNIPASGTEIIKDLGEEHLKTQKPIVYTSADSVFQIAARDTICDALLLVNTRWMRTTFRSARLVLSESTRLRPRRRSAALADEDLMWFIGKIADLRFNWRDHLTAKNNEQSITKQFARRKSHADDNLVDFDMLYGHRRDTEGYAKALEHFDARLPEIEAAMNADDLMIITADHGNDPTFPGSDHTREYAPLLVFGKTAKTGDLGTRASLADIGQTIAENFGLRLTAGESFLKDL